MFASRTLRYLVTHDGDVCIRCWGLVPRDGVTYVPEDGELCSCSTLTVILDQKHNEPNPVLTLFRSVHDGDMRGWGLWWALATHDMLRDRQCEPAHADHARRVLGRLASLTERMQP